MGCMAKFVPEGTWHIESHTGLYEPEWESKCNDNILSLMRLIVSSCEVILQGVLISRQLCSHPRPAAVPVPPSA